MKSPPLSLLLVSALGLLACACNLVAPAQIDSTRYYVLMPPAPSPASEGQAPTGKLRIGLRNVALAGYLKGRSIVVRNGANEIVLKEYTLWAEPLDAGITRILRSSLAGAPPVARVYPEPFPFDAERDYDVAVTINRCEGSAGGHPAARFEALIEITAAGDNARVIARKLFTGPDAPWDGKNFGQLAALLSNAVEALSREIVGALPPSP